MIFVEPTAVYEARLRQRSQQAGASAGASPSPDYTGWQQAISQEVQAAGPQPVLLMRVVNECAKVMGWRPRANLDAIKREILREIGLMIRQGKLVRVMRKFVQLPPASTEGDKTPPKSTVTIRPSPNAL